LAFLTTETVLRFCGSKKNYARPYQFPVVTFVLFAATGLAAVAGAVTWRHREVPGSVPFVVLMALVALWTLTYGIVRSL